MQFYILFIKTWYTLIYCAIIAFFLCFVFIFYISRHTWATMAYYSEVHPGIISEAMGHSSITVTETYLKPFKNKKIDEANATVFSPFRKTFLKISCWLIWCYFLGNGKKIRCKYGHILENMQTKKILFLINY